MLLKRCFPGALCLLAAAAATWDQLRLANLPTRRRSRHRYPTGWKKSLIAALAALGLFLLAFPLLHGVLAQGLFLLAVLLFLSLFDPFKTSEDNGDTRRLKKAGLAASLAMLTLLPGFGLPTLPSTNRARPLANSVAEAQVPDLHLMERTNAVARLEPDSLAELEPKDVELVSAQQMVVPVADAEPTPNQPAPGPRRPSGFLLAMRNGEAPVRLWDQSNWLSPNASETRIGGSQRSEPRGGGSGMGQSAHRSDGQSILQILPSAQQNTATLVAAVNPPADPGQPTDRLPQPGEVSPVDIGGSLVEVIPLPDNTVALLPGRGGDTESDLLETGLPVAPPSGTGLDDKAVAGIDPYPVPSLQGDEGQGVEVTLDPFGLTPPDPVVLSAPEPGSLVLLGMGAFGLLGYRLRRGTRKARAVAPVCQRG